MRFKFLTDSAILLEPDKILVITDLHIGIEYEIYRSGISIPSQIARLKKRIESLIKQTKAKHLIILGDVKHQVPMISKQEIVEIPEFLDSISKKIKVSIVKGNHDGNIEKLANSKIKIYDASGFRIKNMGFIHGNAWMNEDLLKAEYIFSGHIHPMLEFKSNGYRMAEQCWVISDADTKNIEEHFKKKSKIKEIIIMPVFNTMLGGVYINSKEFNMHGLILNNKIVKWKESKIYLLDGTYVGILNNLY